MAIVGKKYETKLYLRPDLVTEGRKRAKELGYRSFSEFTRYVLSRELRDPRIPDAHAMRGRTPRQMGLSRPKR